MSGASDGLVRMEWQHPRYGRLSEIVCPRHEREVLAALRTLGIGCMGTPNRQAGACLRCRNAQHQFREYAHAAAVS